MRNALGVLALGYAGWLCACSAPRHTTTAALELRALPSCALPRAERIAVRASGDFTTQSLDFAAGAAFDDDGLPPDTRFLAVEAGNRDARAGGLVALSGDDVRRALWMLPFGRSCPLSDPLVAAGDGAAFSPLADGGLLIVGGRADDGAASANAFVLAPGAALAEEVQDGMLFRRVDATATPVAGGVLVVGGADDDREREVEHMQMRSAHDRFELFVDALGRFDMARAGRLQAGPRRDHSALLLGDGRVLIVGGVSALGTAPLRTAELIDVVSGRARALEAELERGRVRPTLLALDSGVVLVALGAATSEVDREHGASVREIERFDVEHERFETLAVRLPEREHAAVAALEGDRVAYVGCDEGDAACEIALLLPDAEGGFELLRPDFYDAPLLNDPEGLRGLSQLRLLPLHDGRLLVTGRSADAGTSRRGFVLDLNALAIERAELSRVPDVLLELADGSRVEADASGLSLARDDTQSVLDDAPSKVVGADASALALDAAARWKLDEGLSALQDARADLPRLRFADVRIEVAWSGKASLLLEADRAAPASIALDEDKIAIGDCELGRASGDAIAIERSGARVVLHSGDHSRTCSAPSLGARVGIAIRASQGARISRLSVERL